MGDPDAVAGCPKEGASHNYARLLWPLWSCHYLRQGRWCNERRKPRLWRKRFRQSCATPVRYSGFSPESPWDDDAVDRPVAGVSWVRAGGSAGAIPEGAGRQRFSQAGGETTYVPLGVARPVLRGVGHARLASCSPTGYVSGAHHRMVDNWRPTIECQSGTLRVASTAVLNQRPTGAVSPPRRSWPWNGGGSPRPEDTSRSGWPEIQPSLREGLAEAVRLGRRPDIGLVGTDLDRSALPG